VEAAGASLGITVIPARINRIEALNEALVTLVRDGAQALVVTEDLFTYGNRDAIVAAAAVHRIAGIFSNREFVAAGGLLSYGADWDERIRQYGRYLGRILQGARPQDLPIDQPTKFELVINLKAATALGLTIPPAVLTRADEVIE
jgi:putative ABC transport system substrate-binding protein